MSCLPYDYTAKPTKGPAAVSNDCRTLGQRVAEFFTGSTVSDATDYERLPLHRRIKIHLMLKRLERSLIARAKAERPRVYCDPVIHAGRGKSAVINPSHPMHKDFWDEVAREAQK